MRLVNGYFIAKYVAGLTGMADDEESVVRYRSLDVNDPLQMKPIIQRELKPDFESLNDKQKAMAKLSFQYYLSTEHFDWEKEFDCHLLPFRTPDSPRDFYVWIWNVFYGDEDYHLPSVDDIVEINDIDQTHELR